MQKGFDAHWNSFGNHDIEPKKKVSLALEKVLASASSVYRLSSSLPEPAASLSYTGYGWVKPKSEVPMFFSIRVLLVILAFAAISSSALAGTVFYLGASPQRSNCYNVNLSACRAMDGVEASGYEMARRGQISWVAMVDRYYRERSRVFPYMRDDHVTTEIRAYQRVLAEKVDARKISEAEWVYLLVKQESELESREAQVQNSRNPNVYQPRNAPSYNCEKFGPGYSCNPIN